MIPIFYAQAIAVITCLWILLRVHFNTKTRRINWKRELQLLLVYTCIIVVVRFAFFPFSKVNGKIQPLLFNLAMVYPPRINLIPLVNLLDYEVFREMLINVIGNISMFIPIGVIWPAVFRELDRPWKVIAAGIGFSLCIEILQLPFFDRVTDVDDLILNSAGFLAGYGAYLLVKTIKKRCGNHV